MRGRSLVPPRSARRIASLTRILSLVSATLVCCPAWSQEPATSGSPTKPAVKDERNLLQRTGWIRLEIVGGRIAVLGHRCGQSRVMQTADATETPREQLSVQLCTESLVVHYEDVQAERRVAVDLDDQQRLTISRTSASPSAEFKFVQPFQGPVTLSLGRDPVQSLTAGSVWHLALKHPELCEESLFPVLESLRPHWRLKDQVSSLQEALISKSGTDVLTQRKEWRQWVSQLDSDDFAARQNADRQLRAAGQSIVAWLHRLDRKQLSAEQAARVQEISQALSDLTIDTPQRVALWMIDDRCAWMSFLQSPEVSVRLAAANHLTHLCGKPVGFDPFASDSDRQQQIAQLQQRFSKP